LAIFRTNFSRFLFVKRKFWSLSLTNGLTSSVSLNQDLANSDASLVVNEGAGFSKTGNEVVLLPIVKL